MKKLIFKVFNYIFFKRSALVKEKKYKHGFPFHSNSLVDTLFPQFVEIGDNFISAPGSIITAHDASTFLFSKKYRVEKVTIGNNVFLGANSVILPGVKIGDNVIVGAGSIVTKNLESGGVYAGNPVKFICTIEDYIERCSMKQNLYDPPEIFLQEYNLGKKFSKDAISQFQQVLQRYAGLNR